MGVLRDSLQPTDFADAVCKVSNWREFGHHGYSSVRVWLCRTGNHWFQRHEWQEDGKNHTCIEEWLYTGHSVSRQFPAHMSNDGLQLIKDSEI